MYERVDECKTLYALSHCNLHTPTQTAIDHSHPQELGGPGMSGSQATWKRKHNHATGETDISAIGVECRNLKKSIRCYQVERCHHHTRRPTKTLTQSSIADMLSLISSFRRLPAGVRTLATEAAEAAAATAGPSKWTPYTVRTGAIARKRGMTALWDQDGRRWPVTVLQLENNQVVRVSPPPENDPKQLHSLQVGASDTTPKATTAQMMGHFKKAGVKPKAKLQEFRVTADAVLPVGAEISAGHFVPGQFVDVTATR